MIKIALISDSIAPFHLGGKENRINEIISRVPSNFEITIYTMDWSKVVDLELNLPNVKLVFISKYHPLYKGERRSIKQGIFFGLSTFRLLREDFDIIDADQMPYLQLFPLKVVALLRRKKMIITWHEYWGFDLWQDYLGKFGGFIAGLIERFSLLLPNYIFAASDFTYSRLLSISKKTIIEIPGGVDDGKILEVNYKTFNYDFIYVGRLISHKNIDLALKAFSELVKVNPKLTFAIIGKGPEEESLVNLTNSLKIVKNVTFIDQLPEQEDLWAYIKNAKVFVSFSNREGFGLTVAEALFCGTPVITSDHLDNASKGLIENGVNGSIVTSDSVDALKVAMLYWFDHSGEIKHNLEHLTWNASAQKYYEIIEGIIYG